jgi:hypothetical protein
MRIRLLCATAAFAATLTVSACGNAVAVPGALSTEAVDTVSQSAGQPQWQTTAETAIANATWTFGDRNQFDFRMPNYTLQGTYTVDGSVVAFKASDSFAVSAGGSRTDISGVLNLDSGDVTFSFSASSISAAVINNQSFGRSSRWAFSGTATLA